MADYARRGDQAQWMRNQAEQMRRMRTARQRRAHVKTLTFREPGEITFVTFFEPCEIAINPAGSRDYPEHKQIVAINGWGNTGEVTVNWQHNTGYFYEGHVVSGGTGNRIILPEPFLIEEDPDFGGEWIRPEIAEEPAFTAANFSFSFTVETVPI